MLLLTSESNQACEKLSCFLSAWHIVEELNRHSNKFRHSEVFWLVIIAIKSSVSSPPPPSLPKWEFDDKVTWLCLTLKEIERFKNSCMLQATQKACKKNLLEWVKWKFAAWKLPNTWLTWKPQETFDWVGSGEKGRGWGRLDASCCWLSFWWIRFPPPWGLLFIHFLPSENLMNIFPASRSEERRKSDETILLKCRKRGIGGTSQPRCKWQQEKPKKRGEKIESSFKNNLFHGNWNEPSTIMLICRYLAYFSRKELLEGETSLRC